MDPLTEQDPQLAAFLAWLEGLTPTQFRALLDGHLQPLNTDDSIPVEGPNDQTNGMQVSGQPVENADANGGGSFSQGSQADTTPNSESVDPAHTQAPSAQGQAGTSPTTRDHDAAMTQNPQGAPAYLHVIRGDLVILDESVATSPEDVYSVSRRQYLTYDSPLQRSLERE
ncbi:hypothetical protein VKT23_004542 [Stygiomarasmius scandens]|uniref:Uncharacterized protein n=1 Tax=Marasmiellus scandens TaxID=2682957 RepID=A0ABR1JV76_9AGAR